MLRLDLQKLFLLLTTATVLLTFGNSYYATYQVQKQLMIDSTLESNRVYAAKLAETTHNFIASAQLQLAYSAGILASDMSNLALLEAEARRLKQQSDFFNTVAIINSDAVIAIVFPIKKTVIGLTLPDNARQSFNARQPLVTDPFLSPSGNYIVSLSEPIFSTSGDYLGYVTGTIYLHDDNVFFKLLGQHSHNDGSYIFVANKNRELLYHYDPERIGELVNGNTVLDASINGQKGSAMVVNSKGVPMLAGYAHIERAGWGVVAQRPVDSVMAELDVQLTQVILKSLPMLLFILLSIWIASRYITKPLQALALFASDMDKNLSQTHINHIKAWYFEVNSLKQAILSGLGSLNNRINQLHEDSNTDPLTHFYNRRGLVSILDTWEEREISFAVVALDIDHFKVVNDTHGHDVGDKVLQQLCELIRAYPHHGAVFCRSGGEEFLIMLPETSAQAAYQYAEGLRNQIANVDMPTAGKITVSLGISIWRADDKHCSIKTALKTADIALYQAKRNGRNCSIIAE